MSARPASPPFSLGLGEGVDALLGLGTLQRLYEALPPGDFVDRALEQLQVEVGAEGAEAVPTAGAAIVVCNHPTGALDGLALLRALRQRRSDVRVLGNRWLTRIPEMREWTIPVDPFGLSRASNVAGLRRARRWLETGGLLAVFPAGAVARRPGALGAVDEPWHEGVLSLARWTDARVVPAFMTGRPSAWFRVLGRVHPAMGTALLPRELLRQRGSRVRIRFGEGVAATRLDALPSAAARLAYLRTRVGALEPPPDRSVAAAPLAPVVIPSLLRQEVHALPDACRLAGSRELRVFCAAAGQIPHVLREIGRLRETTFRQAGEGTGRSLDLDEFDSRYLHLFLWHETRAEVVGAYRLGLAGAPHGGPLYTESLFAWRGRPVATLGPSLELGRSFVRTEYQRDPSALLLLWKGIGAYVARHPQHRRLFGPVSISADYHPLTRSLIAAWMERDQSAAAAPVRARHPVRHDPDVRALVESGAIASVADLDTVVRELEGGRGLPVLLRQYLRLNGRVLALSHDPAFGNVIDVLLVVDMLEMPASHLERYCGADGARRIRAFHRRPDATGDYGLSPDTPAAGGASSEERSRRSPLSA